MEEALIKLSWQTQVALGSGYAAYALAYSGIRDHHKGVDIAFRAIAFGLITTFIMFIMSRVSAVFTLPVAFVITLVAAVIWRKTGMDLWRSLLRQDDVTWADDVPAAWTAITSHNSRHLVSQISVELDDGSWLNCNDTSAFRDDPFGPCTLGLNGDLALYVTDESDAHGTKTINSRIRDADYGVRITYVPAARVRRITMRTIKG